MKTKTQSFQAESIQLDANVATAFVDMQVQGAEPTDAQQSFVSGGGRRNNDASLESVRCLRRPAHASADREVVDYGVSGHPSACGASGQIKLFKRGGKMRHRGVGQPGSHVPARKMGA